MKKILILTSKHNVIRRKLIQTLSKRFWGQADVKLDFLENFTSVISKNKLQGFISGVNLSAFNLVYFSGKRAFLTAPKAIAMCLESNSIPFFGYTSYMGNKLTSLTKLAKNNINVPDTVFCSISLVNGLNMNLIKRLGFPIIIKDLNSHQTKGIYAVKTKKELRGFMSSHLGNNLCFKNLSILRMNIGFW